MLFFSAPFAFAEPSLGWWGLWWIEKMLLFLTSSISSQHRTLYNHTLSTKKTMTPLDEFHTFLHFYDSIWPEVLHPMWSCGRTHDETRPISTYDTMSQRCAGTQPAHGQRWNEATTGCAPLVSGKRRFQSAQGWMMEKFMPRKYVSRILFQLK